MARKQDFWNLQTSELYRLGISRRFQKIRINKRFIQSRPRITKRPRKEPYDGICHNSCGDRTIGQDVITNRKFQIYQLFNYTMIDTLIMATYQDQMLFARELPRLGLFKNTPLRCE